MSAADRFFDTNVLLYLFSGDAAKADAAEALLARGGFVSVQVLNEFASVATRELRMTLPEVREALATLTAVCTIVPLTVAIHERGLRIAERHGFSIYDAMIVAAALEAGCSTLLTEDLQDGQSIDRQLRVQNPFAG